MVFIQVAPRLIGMIISMHFMYDASNLKGKRKYHFQVIDYLISLF